MTTYQFLEDLEDLASSVSLVHLQYLIGVLELYLISVGMWRLISSSQQLPTPKTIDLQREEYALLVRINPEQGPVGDEDLYTQVYPGTNEVQQKWGFFTKRFRADGMFSCSLHAPREHRANMMDREYHINHRPKFISAPTSRYWSDLVDTSGAITVARTRDTDSLESIPRVRQHTASTRQTRFIPFDLRSNHDVRKITACSDFRELVKGIARWQ
jgi:hypothetical protein